MVGAPPPIVIPQTPPAGSSAIDVNAILPANLLTYLTDSAKTLFLSAANIGKSTTSIIENALETIDVLADLTTYQIDGTPLNSLADAATSSFFVVTNVGTSNYVRIIILLNEFQPTSGGMISISDGITAYELELAATLSEKRIEFNNIAASFVASFTVTNDTGTTFSSYGNSIVVVPL